MYVGHRRRRCTLDSGAVWYLSKIGSSIQKRGSVRRRRRGSGTRLRRANDYGGKQFDVFFFNFVVVVVFFFLGKGSRNGFQKGITLLVQGANETITVVGTSFYRESDDD